MAAHKTFFRSAAFCLDEKYICPNLLQLASYRSYFLGPKVSNYKSKFKYIGLNRVICDFKTLEVLICLDLSASLP